MNAPLPTLTPTPEQAAIIAAARNTRENLLISALAGCAKTSTLYLIVRALPVQPTLCLAFNKRIATEMASKMPGHCNCATLNSIGHRSWAQRLGGQRLSVSSDKTANLLKAYIEESPKADQRSLWDNFAAITRTLRAAKTQGVLSPRHETSADGLSPFDEFIETPDDELDLEEAEVRSVIATLLFRSTEQALQGLIDFDDQLYMPTLFGGKFPNYPLVLIDEAQDLSPLNHAMLRRVAQRRLIAVGDSNQSIYGFRGAVMGGMDALREEWRMTELTLSVTFRCPKALVRRAQTRVPHFRWAEGAPEGEVLFSIGSDISRFHTKEGIEWGGDLTSDIVKLWWTASTVPNGAAIICRNNAPLLSVALALIRAGRGVNLVGSDIGVSLIKALRSFGEATLPSSEVLSAIDKWEADRIKRRPQSEAATRDRASCLRVFAEAGDTLATAITAAERVFSASGPIQLLSGHKAKGLEWETVYHLDPFRIPSKFAFSQAAKEQELNLRYVIETRARQRLILVNAEDLQ